MTGCFLLGLLLTKQFFFIFQNFQNSIYRKSWDVMVYKYENLIWGEWFIGLRY